MTTVYNEARDQIFELFNIAWLETEAIVSYVPEVRWQGKEVGDVPDGSKFWCRVSTQSVFERQSTLSNAAGEPGKKHYNSSGLVFVQLFAPKEIDTSYEQAQLLARIARDAFRGKTTIGKVWFRNVRINNLEPEELFYRFNIVAEYEYDEVG